MSIACPDCGTLVDLPSVAAGGTATCPVCHHALERSAGRNIAGALACSAATFALLFPANLLPLMDVHLLGLHTESRIGSSVLALWDRHWVIVAILTAAFVVILPLLRFGLLTVVLACLQLHRHPRWLGRAFRWSLHLDHWAMPDVFLIGCAVGYSRIAANLPVTISAGGFCMIGAALLCMATRASLDRRTVWRSIAAGPAEPPADIEVISCQACDLVVPAALDGQPCPRCRLTLNSRKPHAMARTFAFTLAGLVLYLPANFYPMSSALQMGTLTPHRIVDGIRELITAGFWPLAIVIFCTSIAIPALKLIGLSWLMLSVRRHSTRHLVLKTHFHRIINEVGRWSCVDVFTVAVFLPLIQFGALASTRPGVGLVAFLLVVVFTMIASSSFDVRLIWDAAHSGPREKLGILHGKLRHGHAT
ncbi:MAG TPA: paraquat-inducible protein A [Nevskiaceae bacterium]|nr:paraquat-inducible protein A [Nevskiaceae bacterium]